jgi:hypothetical protein
MPIWLIEFVAAGDLAAAFVWIALMTAPVWIAMIAFPWALIVRRAAQPLTVAVVYALALCALLWSCFPIKVLPSLVHGVNYSVAREMSQHPVVFLVLFCNLQILNLVVGAVMYQKARRLGLRIPIELTICWGLGVVAVLPFAIRLLLRGRALR